MNEDRPVVRRASLLEGASSATGWVVIIDVYRAMTTMCVLLAGGVERLWLVGDVERALELRRRGLVDACVGEIEGRPVPGFDHGNSPSEVARSDWRGKRVVLSTRSGVVGLELARHAELRLGAGFVNLSATVRYLRAHRPREITLVAMGWAGRERTEEDEACADLIEAQLYGRVLHLPSLMARVRASAESQKFGDPAQPWFPEADREMALEMDRYGFAIVAVPERDYLRACAVCVPENESHG
jgi:2-phosphosulfolactate phosphatase